MKFIDFFAGIGGEGLDFLRCIVDLGQLGYDLEYQLLNSKDFGVPTASSL